MRMQRISTVLSLLAFMTIASLSSAQTVAGNSCVDLLGRAPADISIFGHGVLSAPRNAIRINNLKWELPIIGATAALIATGADSHVSSHIHSTSFVNNSALASNVGLGLELGAAGLLYVGGCAHHRSSYAANTGWTALEAIGAANLMTLGVKEMVNRQYPYTGTGSGEFWEGGKSFPSGHAATSFAFASVVAHRYPHNLWLKVGAYGLATGVSLARVGGLKHFPSDVLVGATIGYVSGTYLTQHTGEPR
jgi:membrane-associated phospholipid phosphatase